MKKKGISQNVGLTQTYFWLAPYTAALPALPAFSSKLSRKKILQKIREHQTSQIRDMHQNEVLLLRLVQQFLPSLVVETLKLKWLIFLCPTSLKAGIVDVCTEKKMLLEPFNFSKVSYFNNFIPLYYYSYLFLKQPYHMQKCRNCLQKLVFTTAYVSFMEVTTSAILTMYFILKSIRC